MDNLCNWRFCLVDWCGIFKWSGGSIDHLLLHCSYAQEIWSMVFCLFGLKWVIPSGVLDLLDCWKGGFGWQCKADIWGAMPFCAMWII